MVTVSLFPQVSLSLPAPIAANLENVVFVFACPTQPNLEPSLSQKVLLGLMQQKHHSAAGNLDYVEALPNSSFTSNI